MGVLGQWLVPMSPEKHPLKTATFPGAQLCRGLSTRGDSVAARMRDLHHSARPAVTSQQPRGSCRGWNETVPWLLLERPRGGGRRVSEGANCSSETLPGHWLTCPVPGAGRALLLGHSLWVLHSLIQLSVHPSFCSLNPGVPS